jgi:hypothetical protein
VVSYVGVVIASEWLVVWAFDLRGIAEEERRPLVGFAAHERGEVHKTLADGQLSNGPT